MKLTIGVLCFIVYSVLLGWIVSTDSRKWISQREVWETEANIRLQAINDKLNEELAAKDLLIEALKRQTVAQDGLIDALQSNADAQKRLAEQRGRIMDGVFSLGPTIEAGRMYP